MSSGEPIRNVLILIAMEAEAAPFLSTLSLQKADWQHPGAPCVIYSGMHKGVIVSVCTNGLCSKHDNTVNNVGTTPAAISAFLTISQLKPDLIINAGTAGGFKSKGAAIGDSFISTFMRHHDRRIPIPGSEGYSRGHHASLACPNLVASLGFKTGVVTTSNSLDHTEMDNSIMAENGQ